MEEVLIAGGCGMWDDPSDGDLTNSQQTQFAKFATPINLDTCEKRNATNAYRTP